MEQFLPLHRGGFSAALARLRPAGDEFHHRGHGEHGEWSKITSVLSVVKGRNPSSNKTLEASAPVAYLSRLVLTNFRSLLQLDLALPAGVVVFFGDNAQGKTTLLEAAYLLAIGRSFRADAEREVLNFQAAAGGESALVGGHIAKGGESDALHLQIYVGFRPVGAAPAAAAGPDALEQAPQRPGLNYSVQKEVRVSRSRRTAAGLVGLLGAVLFSAEDIQLVQGPPSGRRRYLDILSSQADPMYLKSLQRYQRMVQQRNRLLRALREGRAQAPELEFWDQELVREGSLITWQRRQATIALSRLCDAEYRQLSGSAEELTLRYQPSMPPGEDLADTQRGFRQRLARLRPRELAAGATLLGPHRDDFLLLSKGVDLGVFASRGEARTLALALRLAEAAYLSAARGDEPVVLLDDVLSELDASRRRLVLQKVAGYQQALITTTDLAPVAAAFQELGVRASYFRVAGGAVTAAE
ncbi:MAG: DNA replication and repair protein RecF [Dehalococcoidia bacterium]|nr:DNA replication and repair protein RecF [Dehalococcoidia bacterium]MSQ17330.1 DNA replication and repair protein RecF [Dehalococcoidia bacterium]